MKNTWRKVNTGDDIRGDYQDDLLSFHWPRVQQVVYLADCKYMVGSLTDLVEMDHYIQMVKMP